jgi:hypothetical protein
MRGHIRRRGANSFEIKYDVANTSGARKTVYRSFKGTRREAQAERFDEPLRLAAISASSSLASFLAR